MDPKRKYSKAEVVDTHVLPDMAFDLGEGRKLPEKLGKTAIPSLILPDMAFDLRAFPVLQVTVHIRPEATRAQIDRDLQLLCTALNQLDLSLCGHGLAPDEELSRQCANGSHTLNFRPNRREGADQRFAKMVTLINSSAPTA